MNQLLTFGKNKKQIRMKVRQVISETPGSFLARLKEHAFIERKSLRLCANRLACLIKTLEFSDISQDDRSLQDIAVFATLVATYDKGFLVILEPSSSDMAEVPDPVLHFVCLDAAIAIRPVFQKYYTVIITSGTLSPLDMYSKILNFTTILQESYTTTLARDSFLPMIVTREDDQTALTTSLQTRNEPGLIRSYGRLVADFARITPDGLVVFFPSYLYMESIISAWQGMEILDEIWRYKLILVETPDAHESSLALETYRTACINGRGALFFLRCTWQSFRRN
jgi:DNA excision repair protein ERCC-2